MYYVVSNQQEDAKLQALNPIYTVYSVYHATNGLFTPKFLDFITTSPSSEALYKLGYCIH
jgi:hypothetical protein